MSHKECEILDYIPGLRFRFLEAFFAFQIVVRCLSIPGQGSLHPFSIISPPFHPANVRNFGEARAGDNENQHEKWLLKSLILRIIIYNLP